MTAERFYYDFEDPLGHKIMDVEKSINYPLETVGDFRKITDLLNEYADETILLKKENEQLKEENKSWLKTASRMNTIHHEDREYCERVHRENDELRKHINDTEIAVEIETEKQMNNISEVIDKKIEEYNNIRETYKQENKNSLDDLKMVDASILALQGLKKELGL